MADGRGARNPGLLSESVSAACSFSSWLWAGEGSVPKLSVVPGWDVLSVREALLRGTRGLRVLCAGSGLVALPSAALSRFVLTGAFASHEMVNRTRTDRALPAPPCLLPRSSPLPGCSEEATEVTVLNEGSRPHTCLVTLWRGPGVLVGSALVWGLHRSGRRGPVFVHSFQNSLRWHEKASQDGGAQLGKHLLL